MANYEVVEPPETPSDLRTPHDALSNPPLQNSPLKGLNAHKGASLYWRARTKFQPSFVVILYH